MNTYFVTGIDTDIGKTYVTGMIGRYLVRAGKQAITMKIAQTGFDRMSEDIQFHRKIMGIPLMDEDHSGLTCPYLFRFASSPHLAAELEERQIDMERIHDNHKKLSNAYQWVVMEGVGGLYVPLNRETFLIEYLEQMRFPVIVVTSGRLGSINHTFLTLEALISRSIPVAGIVYNLYPREKPEITRDSKELIRSHYTHIPLIETPLIDRELAPDIDFSPFFQH